MQKVTVHHPDIKLVGKKARTSYALESNGETALIWPTIQKYFQLEGPQKIQNMISPGVTYSAYTEYESDCNGEYTYFFGVQVSSFDQVPEGFFTMTIPAQKYTKFTSQPGIMPQVCIELWQNIWAMSPADLGGVREYKADFEVYDERSINPEQVVLDIYIGVKP